MSNQFSVRLNKTNKLNVNVLLSPFSSVFHGPAICRCASLSTPPAPEVCFCNSVIIVDLFDMEPQQRFMFLTSRSVQRII